ncbi:Xyloglucan galactosyltransferase [Actinidia chinensis var. chinensis]|uniref:Xyloglucan galactosyltransferase n=1 Tax=Actinidia chinensis var. chinensis TaxID=1590841 RepID=A0A2R6PI87_ACTCC|nr:Xyloglucan galactosyltransferase [Actinidia chinensis var. chinensis]
MKTILSLIAALSLSSLLVFGPVNSQQPDIDPVECSGRWIHIRNLPTRFNLDLLTNCSDFPLFDDFCPYLANHGLGQKTHNQTRSWYRTDPFMLELIFHRRMLEYPCLTADPAVASAVFLPYYAGIDSLRYLYGSDVNSSFEHGLDLFQFLKHYDSPQIWGNHQGHDHFLVMARPAWDFSQSVSCDQPIWGTSFLELPEFYNITALILESRTWPWQEQAIPYPTSFHPPNTALFEAWMTRVRQSRRSTLMVFAGGGGSSSSPNIRRSIRLECENSANSSEINDEYSKSCEFIDCSNGVCEHDPIRFMRPMLQSDFCLQPPGDTPTRRSTFDGIIAGCIPVFFEDQSAKTQYTWHLPEDKYNDFSVYIPKEDVVFKGVKILDVLLGIPRDKVRRMRESVLEIIPRVMYRKHGSSPGLKTMKDAFDIAVEGTLQRIKGRLQQVPLH